MASTTVQNRNGLFSNPLFVRSLGWSNLWVMFAYLFNNFATFWGGLPGASMYNGTVGLLQLLLYPAARGPYVHIPLIILGIILATRTKTLGFHWLALLIVVGELMIVVFRFIFSYEQAFMSDLVRFWYGALFLFASAHTLLEEGHVRVDILYAGLKEKSKGRINAIGTIFLGISLCWMIILTGMAQKTSIINSPLLNFETTQSGFGLYVKYMMAGFLGIFAISMMIQFVSYLMAAVADYRGEDGKYIPTGSGAH